MGIKPYQIELEQGSIPFGSTDYLGNQFKPAITDPNFYYTKFISDDGGKLTSRAFNFLTPPSLGLPTLLSSPIPNTLECDPSNVYYTNNSSVRSALALASSVYSSPVVQTMGRNRNTVGNSGIAGGSSGFNNKPIVTVGSAFTGTFTSTSIFGNFVFTLSSGTPWTANAEADFYYLAYSSADPTYSVMLRVNGNTTNTLLFDTCFTASNSIATTIGSFDRVIKIKTPPLIPSTYITRMGSVFDGVNVWDTSGGTAIKTNINTGLQSSWGSFSANLLGFDGTFVWGLTTNTFYNLDVNTNLITTFASSTTLNITSYGKSKNNIASYFDGKNLWFGGWSATDQAYYLVSIDVYTHVVTKRTIGSFTQYHKIRYFFSSPKINDNGSPRVYFVWEFVDNITPSPYEIGVSYWNGGKNDVYHTTNKALATGVPVFNGTYLYFLTYANTILGGSVFSTIYIHVFNIFLGSTDVFSITNPAFFEYADLVFDGESLLVLYGGQTGNLVDRVYVINPNNIYTNMPLSYFELPTIPITAPFVPYNMSVDEGLILNNYYFPYLKTGLKSTEGITKTRHTHLFSRGFARKTKTVTANYTISPNDYRIMFNAGSITLTLPDLNYVEPGTEYHIMNASTGSLTITLAAFSGQTILGTATQSITGASASRHVFAYTDNSGNMSWKMTTP